MSTKFSQSFKIQAVEKALTRPDGTTLVEIAKRLAISISSLTRWITESRNQAYEPKEIDHKMSSITEKRPQDWSLEERFQIIIKCDGLKENEVNAICREQGIHQHHLSLWGNEFTSDPVKPLAVKNTELKALKNENTLLKREVNRKDKALAETAALLVLQKKVHAIWGSSEGDLQ